MAITGNPATVNPPQQEALMAIPQLGRRGTPGDGTEPEPDEPMEQEEAERPTLLTASAQVAFQTIDGLCRSQDRLAVNRFAIDRYYGWLRANVPFGQLYKVPNQNLWISRLPRSVAKESSSPVPNMLDDLCNKVEDTLFADPPKPDPRASDSDEATEEAAKLLKHVLVQHTKQANEVQQYRWAFSVGMTEGSGILEYDVDPHGHWQSMVMLADPLATDPSKPLEYQDPMTGALAHSVNPIMRYVGPEMAAPAPAPIPAPEPGMPGEPDAAMPFDGAAPEFEPQPTRQFVKTAAEADRQWVPGIVIERLRRGQIRTFPPEATIDEATAVLALKWCTLEQAITKWPETVGTMTFEQLAQLASWRPLSAELLVPYALRAGLMDGMTGPGMDQVGTLSPLLQRRMFYYRFQVTDSEEYPGGLWIDITGANGGTELRKETLEYEVTLPVGGQEKRCRIPQFVQVTPQLDTLGGDPLGWPMAARVAGVTEGSATLYAGAQDAVDQRLHPHVAIKSTTPIDEDDWADRSKLTLLNPGDEYPQYEQFSPMPDYLALLQDMRTLADTAMGLGDTARSLETSTAVSGVAKQIVVQQTNKFLSGPAQRYHDAQTRGWKIQAQLMQAYFDSAQMLEFIGEASSDEVQWWTGEDLGGIDDIGIQIGTGSLSTPEGRMQQAAYAQANSWLPPDQAADVGMSGIARELGLKRDPAKASIEREVSAWLKGPPEGWTPAQPAPVDPLTQQPVMDAATGQPMMGQPASFTPFVPRPCNSEVRIATIRMQRLSEVQQNPRYDSFDPSWRALLDQAYLEARQAVAIGTMGAQNPQAPQEPGKPGETKPPESATGKTGPTGQTQPRMVA